MMTTTGYFGSRDFLLGALYCSVGVVFGAFTLKTLAIGQATKMGPGYFPLLISILLVVTGAIIAVIGYVKFAGEEPYDFGWRGLLVIGLATIVFAVFIKPAGFIIATMATAFIASSASRLASVRSSLVISAVLTALCTIVFVFALSLPVSLFGTWFG